MCWLQFIEENNFGKPFEKICQNINKLSREFRGIKFVFPVHPNPYVKKTTNRFFKMNKNVFLTKPADYFTFSFDAIM